MHHRDRRLHSPPHGSRWAPPGRGGAPPAGCRHHRSLEATGHSRRILPRPNTIRDIEDCQTFDAVLPGRNVVRCGLPGDSPRTYFRFAIHEMLSGSKVHRDHKTLLETMRAIAPGRDFQCPAEDCSESVPDLTATGNCRCGELIFETDSLRLHERFEDFGSSAQAYTAAQQVVEHQRGHPSARTGSRTGLAGRAALQRGEERHVPRPPEGARPERR